MSIDYNGEVQLWWKEYIEGEKNTDTIERDIRKIPNIELSDKKLTFNKNKNLTIVKISKAPIYEGKEETDSYRRLVRTETIGNGKPPKDLIDIPERKQFEKKV